MMNPAGFGMRVQLLFGKKGVVKGQSGSSNVIRNGGEFFQVRSNSTEKEVAAPKNAKVSIARFPFNTYLDGKGFFINPPKKEDKSMVIGLIKPPKGHLEHQDEASRLGFQKLYLKNVPGDASVFTIGFNDAQDVSLEHFVLEKKNKFFDKYPDGQIHEINFDPIVTEAIVSKNLMHQTLLFNASESTLYDAPLGKMVVFIKTPGGFWDVALHCPISVLYDPKQVASRFVEVVKNLKVWQKSVDDQQTTPSTQKVETKEQLPIVENITNTTKAENGNGTSPATP
jgi:hypothetical protein